MGELITKTALNVLFSAAHLITGSVLAVMLYKLLKTITKKQKNTAVLCMILLSASLGMVLPLNIYGIFPLALAVVAAGLPNAAALPMLISNSIFSLLVPLTDSQFVWRTGGYRIALAFVAAVLAGVLIHLLIKPKHTLIKSACLLPHQANLPFWSKMTQVIKSNISSVGIYLIIGVIVHEVMRAYLLDAAISFISNSPGMTSVAMYFAGLNVVNPFFILAMTIANLLMNFAFLSGLFAFFRLKGAVMFIGYFVLIAAALGVSAYF